MMFNLGILFAITAWNPAAETGENREAFTQDSEYHRGS
jgi:hypothetical protein